ncbi:MAG: tetratricopeptide repeat protein [Cyanobacteria bacterium SZAS-4]|nr:tetratricopeptide repeat protein [Cyanobacteria bacterium SZAS-4]
MPEIGIAALTTIVTHQILPALAKFVVTAGVTKLLKGDGVKKAVKNTCDDLNLVAPHDERVQRRLTQWTESESFKALLTLGKKDHQPLSVEIAIKNFEDTTKVGYSISGDNTKLTNVIPLYLFHLGVQLNIMDKESSAYADARNHIEVMKAIEALPDQIKTVIDSSNAELNAAIHARLDRSDQLFLEAALTKGPEQVLPIKDEVDARLESEVEYDSRIDTIKRHIEHGQVDLANKLLLEIRDEISGEKPSKQLLFRIASNIGVCALKTERYSDAESEFETALACKPDSYISHANVANAAIFQKNSQRAVNNAVQARKLAPKNGFAAAIFILALSANKESSRIKELVAAERWLLTDPLCLLALGRHHYDCGEFETAEKCARQSTAKNPYDPQALILVAEAIFRQVQLLLLADLPINENMRPEHKARLAEAEDYATKSIGFLETQDSVVQKNQALLFRAAIRLAAFDKEGSRADCNMVLETEPHRIPALIGIAIIDYSAGTFSKTTASLLENLPSDYWPQTAALLGNMYLELDEPALAIKSIDRVKPPPVDNELYSSFLTVRMLGLAALNLNEELETLIQDELAQNGEDVRVLFAIAIVRRRSKRCDEAILLLEKALSLKPQLETWIRRELANNFMDKAEQNARLRNQSLAIRMYQKAVYMFETFLDLDSESADRYSYVVALANSGQLGSAYAEARKLRLKQGKAISVLSEIEATYLEYQYGFFSEARDLIVELLESEPAKPSLRMALSRLNFRLGKS